MGLALAGTAPFSRWSENRATPYAPGPRFLPNGEAAPPTRATAPRAANWPRA